MNTLVYSWCSLSAMRGSGFAAEGTRRSVIELNRIEHVLFVPGPSESLRSSSVRVDHLRSTPAGFGKFLVLICLLPTPNAGSVYLAFFSSASLSCFYKLGLTFDPSRWPSLVEGTRWRVHLYFVICYLCFYCQVLAAVELQEHIWMNEKGVFLRPWH